MSQLFRSAPIGRLISEHSRLTTGTNDALVAAVADRRLDAAFVAVAPSRPSLAHSAVAVHSLPKVLSDVSTPLISGAQGEWGR